VVDLFVAGLSSFEHTVNRGFSYRKINFFRLSSAFLPPFFRLEIDEFEKERREIKPSEWKQAERVVGYIHLQTNQTSPISWTGAEIQGNQNFGLKDCLDIRQPPDAPSAFLDLN
jgi:hypothetical protein